MTEQHLADLYEGIERRTARPIIRERASSHRQFSGCLTR
jgi:hypothetical protein